MNCLPRKRYGRWSSHAIVVITNSGKSGDLFDPHNVGWIDGLDGDDEVHTRIKLQKRKSRVQPMRQDPLDTDIGAEVRIITEFVHSNAFIISLGPFKRTCNDRPQ